MSRVIRTLLFGLVIAVPLLFVAPLTADAEHRGRHYRYYGGHYAHRYYRPYYDRYYVPRYDDHVYGRGLYGTPRFHYHDYGHHGGTLHIGPLRFHWH